MSETENYNPAPSDGGNGAEVASVQKRHFASKKRPPASEAEMYQQKIKRIRDRLQLGSPAENNAVIALHEYNKDLKYEVVGQVGPVHCPSFTIQLVVNGQVFTGTSSSKKKAKLQAAESAVQALLGEPPDVVASAPASATPTKMECEAEDSSPRGVNPTMVLNQLRPGTTYTAVVPDDPSESLGSNGKPLYGMFCVVDGERFEGCGTNKKMSKALAADAALRKLFGIQCAQMPDGSPVFTGDMATLPVLREKVPGGSSRGGTQRPTVPGTNLLVDLPAGKNPVSMLHELYGSSEIAINDDVASETPGIFIASVCVEQQNFQGQGTNKKAARTAAATAAINYLHESGLLNAKLTAKEMKRRQQVPWQPKQRPQFSQTTGENQGPKTPYNGQTRGTRGRGRGRVIARNKPWVSGGVLKASDFLGLHNNLLQDRSQFSMDDDYMQLEQSARNFAAASGGTHGYESYGDYGYMHGTSAGDSGHLYTPQGQKRGGAHSTGGSFTAYGSYSTNASTSQAQMPNQGASRGRGRGLAATARTAGKPSTPAAGSLATYGQKYAGSGSGGYGMAVGATSTQQMQQRSQPLTSGQYAVATAPESYTSAPDHQQQQQLYEAAYAGYDYADASAAYAQQTAYYTAGSGQYVTTDAGATQYYSQF